MKSTSIDKKSIGRGGEQQLDTLEASSDIQPCFCHCGSTLSRNDDGYNGDNNSRITYCRECGMVASRAAGIVVKKDRQEPRQVEEQQGTDTTIPIPRQGPVKMMSQLWISHSKASDQTEKNFAICLGEITRLVQVLSLQPILASKAADICMMTFEKGITRGTSLSVLSAAVVYASARLASLPVTIDQVTEATKLTKSDIIRCFRRLQRRLGLTFEVPSPEAYVTKIITVLSIKSDSDLRTAANKIIRLADEGGRIQGKNPAAVAAAAIYLVLSRLGNGSSSHNGLTQRKLAQAANVTETTIRRACRNLDQQL